MTVEALLVVLSLRGEILATVHIGAPPYKIFASVKACKEWLDGDESDKVAADFSSSLPAVYPTAVRVIPVCHWPFQA